MPSQREIVATVPAARSFSGVIFALVAQRIVFGGDHQCRRQSAQVARPQRRRIGFRRLGRIAEVVVPEPDHRVSRQSIAFGILAIRRRPWRVIVGDRIDQQLTEQREARLRPGSAAPSPRRGCRRRCRLPTTMRPASPSSSAACSRDPSASRTRSRPARRETCARAPAGNRPTPRRIRTGAQIAAHAVMRIQAAQHEAAAVEEHQQRKWPLPHWPIDAQLQVATRTLHGTLGNRCDYPLPAPSERYAPRTASAPRLPTACWLPARRFPCRAMPEFAGQPACRYSTVIVAMGNA